MRTPAVLIIGSGLGGLLCGSILSKEGYAVCVAEKHTQIGGCLQTFTRGGHAFDTGMHYVGSMGPGQVLNRYFTYCGVMKDLHLAKMDEDGFDVVEFGQPRQRFSLPMGAERFVDTLHRAFPAERAALDTYMRTLKQVSTVLDLANVQESEAATLFGNAYISVNAAEYLRSITANTALQNVLAGNNSIYGGNGITTPLYLHALIENSLIDGAWRFVGGSGQLAARLADSIVARGGSVLTGHEAREFIVDNDKVTAVEFTNGERLQADIVVSGIHPVHTFNMIHAKGIRPAFRTRLNSLENHISAFSIHAVLKKHAFPYFNANRHCHCSNDVWSTLHYTAEDWPRGFVLLTPPGETPDVHAGNLTIMTYMRFADVARWSSTQIEQRGEEYRAFKHARAERLLDRVEQFFPGIRSAIDAYHTSSPLTYRDYTGTINGSLYGVVRDSRNPLESYITRRTKIRNLFLTGQNTNMHGALGVTIGAVLTCGELLGLKYLIRRIDEAQ